MLFAPKEKGQGLVEYALILVLVAVVVIAVLTILGPIIGNVFSDINSGFGG
ncbi:MAG: Flp family type IVb pilin [Anaerolineales bacterium]